MPVGIPQPTFGIAEASSVYLGANFKFDFGSGPVPYPQSPKGGPYTHYVDSTASNATDKNNPFGTPEKPRLSVPVDVPAGSVVEIHGGPYRPLGFDDKLVLSGHGKEGAPVFFRGVPGGPLPVFEPDVAVMGEYLVVEHIQFKARLSFRADIYGKDVHHVALRSLKLTGSGKEQKFSAALGGIGRWADADGPWIKNILVSSNTISEYGNWHALVENDWSGVGVGGYNASNIWILDNQIFHMGGDSVRVGSNPSRRHAFTTRRVYVGRNHMYDNRENALDVKGCFDVVASENLMHGFKPSNSDPGSAVAIHYKCSNIWVVANTIRNSNKGITLSDTGDVYLLGNVIYDVNDGINYWGPNEIHVVGNTICRMTNGINATGQAGEPHPVINNIFTGLIGNGGFHAKLNLRGDSGSAMQNNLIYEPDGSFRVYWGNVFSSASSLQKSRRQVSQTFVCDPMFVDAAKGDFRLQASSQARNAGAPVVHYLQLFQQRFGTTLGVDVAGQKRPEGNAPWDLGAFQSPPALAGSAGQ